MIERYYGKHIEIFLNNKLKYTGYIKEVVGTTVVFNDKYGNEVPFECSEVTGINPIIEKGDKDGI